MKKIIITILGILGLGGATVLGGQIINSGTLTIPSITNSYLATDGSGNIIATTTPTISESDPIWTATSSNYLSVAAAASTYQPIGSYLINLLGGLNAILGNTTTTNLSITSVTSTVLATDSSGRVIATTTSSGTSVLFYEDDMFSCPNTTASLYRSVGPFIVQPIGNGGFGAYTTTLGDSNHPGVCSIVDSTTQNTGALIGARSLATILKGGESVSVVFKIPSNVFTSSTIAIGFHDIFDQNDAVDGNYFRMESGTSTIYVKSANNSTRATGTSYTLSADSWYRATVTINSDATAANYYLYDSNGTQILSDTLTTVPSTTNRYVGFGISATEPTTSAAGPIVFIDYISYSQPIPIR